MAILGYVTEAEIIEFMELINEDFGASDINDMIVNAMYQVINSKMDTTYVIADKVLLQDGRGEKFIFCPQIPVVSITRIARVNTDGSETEFVINGTGKNIWWDASTGFFWTDQGISGVIEFNGDSQPFPNRPVSVKFEGSFGQVAIDIVKQLQLMLILKQYSLMQPSVYASDIISEKIGRYEYKLANASNVHPDNQRKGMDGWISFLFSCIPSEDSWSAEVI